MNKQNRKFCKLDADTGKYTYNDSPANELLVLSWTDIIELTTSSINEFKKFKTDSKNVLNDSLNLLLLIYIINLILVHSGFEIK